MARQLPALRDQAPIDLASPRKSALATTATAASRLAIAAAPEVLRIAERLANERQRNRLQRRAAGIPDSPDEAIRLSEVEVDFSLPFVKKVTIRKAFAWSKSSGSANVVEIRDQRSDRSRTQLRRIGLLGISAASAAIGGYLVLKAGTILGNRQVIEIRGLPRD